MQDQHQRSVVGLAAFEPIEVEEVAVRQLRWYYETRLLAAPDDRMEAKVGAPARQRSSSRVDSEATGPANSGSLRSCSSLGLELRQLRPTSVEAFDLALCVLQGAHALR